MKHVYMLFAAIALEVTGTTFMKFSVMHEWLIGYPVMLLLMGFSYFCLSKAVKKIPISVAYAVWEGIGLMGTAFIAWIIFGLIAGIIAKLIMPGRDGGGFFLTCILGIVGAVVGGWLATMFGIGGSISGFNLHSFLVAVVGAILVLGVFRLLRRE